MTSVMDLTETEKAHLAGLFDGEGSVGYYLKNTGGYHVAQVAIYNSDPNIMEWIRKRIPFGSIVTNKVSKHIGWAWMISSKNQATEFLTLIRPYLIIKAAQVDLLLSLLNAEQKVCGSGKKLSAKSFEMREETAKQLKLLKTANFQSVQ